MTSVLKIKPAPDVASSGTDLFKLAEEFGFGDIHFKIDHATGLRAIIAIHNTRLGPALGGCRCIPYPDTDAALYDAMRLSRAMSYKAAMAGLPLGGGKAVIMRPERIEDRNALFEAYGAFVDELGGRYISSVDSGTGVTDMDAAARRTRYVRSTSDSGDPSPSTARGVRRGIQAAVKHKLGRDSLEGVHVAIQGAGHVGYYLAKELYAEGARLSICDINPETVARCAHDFKAAVIAPDVIYSVDADVFAPCALGGAINDTTLKQLKVQIVAGATNNVLADPRHALELHKRGILYAPDYVINAGGLMQVWIKDETELQQKVDGIYNTLMDIFARAEQTHTSPAVVVDPMAEKIIYG